MHAHLVYERHREQKIERADMSKGLRKPRPVLPGCELKPSILRPEGRKVLREQFEAKIAMVTGIERFNIQ